MFNWNLIFTLLLITLIYCIWDKFGSTEVIFFGILVNFILFTYLIQLLDNNLELTNILIFFFFLASLDLLIYYYYIYIKFTLGSIKNI